MTILRTIPAVLAALLVAAHFLRAAQPVGVALGLLVILLLFVPVPWVRLAARVALVLAALEWLRTTWVLATSRAGAGEPYARLLAILVPVALFTLFAAWILPPRARRHGTLAASAASRTRQANQHESEGD